MGDTKKDLQRYYYNEKYYQKGGPCILLVGGEGPEQGLWADDSRGLPHFEWAKTFNASVFNLEHRFYGMTRPFVYVVFKSDHGLTLASLVTCSVIYNGNQEMHL